MRQKPLPIGIDNFEILITGIYYFLDKTLLIKDLIDNKAAVNLFTRPRRFGKTLNISMLQYYFEDRRDEITGEKIDNSHLFKGLNIKAAGEKYTQYMGKYPVINLSLKSAKQPTYKMAYESLIDEIMKEYRRHKFILTSDKLLECEKKIFVDILNGEAKEIEYSRSLQFLSICLEKYFGNKIIILIDECDVLLENAFFEGFYDEIIRFTRSVSECALERNSSLEFAIITGGFSIFKELNNLKIISILDDRYAEYFGFTDNEVIKICDDYNIEHKYETIKRWFNGYIFGKENLYNPWSVIHYINGLKANKNKLLESYCLNTSSNSIIKNFIERANDTTKWEIETLIEGKTIEKPLHEDITYNDIYDDLDSLWNFILFKGYFKKISERMDENTQEKFVELAIPNLEVKYIFRTKILKWFNEKIKSEDLSILYTSIINGEVDVFQKEVNRLLKKTISFNDAYENFYHGFMIGLLSHMDGYIVKSNRETGDGRCDIYIKPLSIFDKAVIIEMKVCDKPKELFTKPQDALQQIEDKKYAYELNESGYEDIIKYGMAFYRKDCIIKIKE